MRKWPWFLLSILVVIVDQATKNMATSWLEPYYPIEILPMLNLNLAFNTGAAFSFLSGAGSWHLWFFMTFSAFVSALLIMWLIKLPVGARMQACSLSLILGGAVGNLIDRIHLGYVVDFIDVYYQHYHWPIFNVADTAITIGAFLLIVDLFISPKE